MSRNSTEGRLLTKYEEALDSHHKSLALWSRPRPVARFALLAAYDMINLVLPLGMLGNSPNVHTVQQIKWWHDCLIHGLRFFWSDDPQTSVTPPLDEPVVKEAFDFLEFCKNYGMLADFHAGFGRGLHKLEASEAERRIRFCPAPTAGSAPDPLGIIEGHGNEWGHMERLLGMRDMGRAVFSTLQTIPHRFEAGRAVLDDVSGLAAPVLDQAVSALIPPPEISLEGTCDLGGFTVGDLRIFWTAMFKWSMAAIEAYLSAITTGKPQREHLPTQVVRRTELVERLTRLTKLPEDVVEACVRRISFGSQSAKNPDVFLQPLLDDGEWVAWSPFLFQINRYERNQLKLMARSPGLKPTADNLIGEREHVVTRRLCAALGEHGYQSKRGIPLPNGTGEIDILAFHHKRPSEVLVVEVKAVLEVDEVNEVNHATDEMIGAQGQLRKVFGVLSALDPAGRARLWSKPEWGDGCKLYGLVLTPDTQPNGRYDQRELPATSLATMREHFRPHAWKSPSSIWRAAASKPWIKQFTGLKCEYFPIQVGDVTYELPSYRLNEPADPDPR